MQDEIVDIIIKYLRHNVTEDERARLLQWLKQSEENKRFYSLFVANCSLHNTISSDNLNRDRESMVARLNARIDAAAPRRNFRPLYLAFASVAAAALALLLVFHPFRRPEAVPEDPMEQLLNSTAETIHFALDDGTRVYLSPGSSLRYNVATLTGRREAVLNGDAYFDVAHDENRPFTVRTENIGVRVLGTAFSVSSSPEFSQVVLERGAVRLLSPEGASMVTLSPNQKATFKSISGDVRVEPVYATAFVTDKYKLMSISDATIKEITAKLSSNFHKKIVFVGGDPDKRYNLAVLKSDSLEDILSILEYMTGAQFTIQ